MPSYHPFLKFSKNIRLPEYGYIGITELEQAIIDTFYFQRLRRIRQSPGVSLTYPGASHSRFEHSLGAMHIAGEVALHLILNSKFTDDVRPLVDYHDSPKEKIFFSKQIQIARLGGLLHDIGHGPFSHTFETFLELCGKSFPHEFLSIEIIWKKLKDKFSDKEKNPLQVDVRHIISLICDLDREISGNISINTSNKKFLKSIQLKTSDISFMENFLKENWFLNFIIKEDPYNADRFNYLILDSNRSGAVEYGSIDFERLIQNMYIHNGVVTVGTKAKDSAMRFFEAYSHMYKSIYQHKTSYGADLHLAYAMYLASEKQPSSIFKKLKNKHDMDAILPLFDDVLIYHLYQIKNNKIKPFIKDFLERRVLSQVYETAKPKFQELIETHGKNGLIEIIIKKSKIPKNTIIRIASIREKRASPPPLDEDALRRVRFFNTKTKEMEPMDEDFIRVFSQKRSYRVYAQKNNEIKTKIFSTINGLVG